MTMQELANHVARIAKVRVPKLVLPRAFGLPAVAAMEAPARRSGKEPLVSYNAARFTSASPHFSSDKAKRELGFQVRPLEATLERAIRFFREAGMA